MQYYKLQYPERKWRSEVQNMLGFVSNVHHNNFILKFHPRLAFIRRIRLAITQRRGHLDTSLGANTYVCCISFTSRSLFGDNGRHNGLRNKVRAIHNATFLTSVPGLVWKFNFWPVSVCLTNRVFIVKEIMCNPSEDFQVVIREASLFVFQRETCCTKPRLGTPGQWFDFEPHTWTTLKVSFQRGSKRAAFLCISRAFEEFRPCIFEVRTTHATKLWKFPQRVQQRQRTWVDSANQSRDHSW